MSLLPFPALHLSHPVVALHQPRSHKAAPGQQHPLSADAGSLAGAGAFLVPPALICPVSGAEGTAGPVLFHSWGFHVMLGRGHQLFTLPGWGPCFPASLFSCGTSPQPLSSDFL